MQAAAAAAQMKKPMLPVALKMQPSIPSKAKSFEQQLNHPTSNHTCIPKIRRVHPSRQRCTFWQHQPLKSIRSLLATSRCVFQMVAALFSLPQI
jgi:hypothetical protein